MNNRKSDWDKENICRITFENSDAIFHLNTPEDHPVILISHKDFEAGMNLLALAFSLFMDIEIIAFQLMSNHIHILFSGDEKRAKEAFFLFRKFLKRYISSQGRPSNLDDFVPKISAVKTLDNCRNAIAYVNRNGFVVNPDETPFSYPWGTSRYYFNPEARRRFRSEGKKSTVAFRQRASHSRLCDSLSDLVLVDGYISPLSFCKIDKGEMMFRDARNYFFRIARNLESSKQIAEMIGETVYYVDEDLFFAAQSIAKRDYGFDYPHVLEPKQKIELAKKLHFDYNATNKQLKRILRLEDSVINSLFPFSVKPPSKAD